MGIGVFGQYALFLTHIYYGWSCINGKFRQIRLFHAAKNASLCVVAILGAFLIRQHR